MKVTLAAAIATLFLSLAGCANGPFDSMNTGATGASTSSSMGGGRMDGGRVGGTLRPSGGDASG